MLIVLSSTFRSPADYWCIRGVHKKEIQCVFTTHMCNAYNMNPLGVFVWQQCSCQCIQLPFLTPSSALLLLEPEDTKIAQHILYTSQQGFLQAWSCFVSVLCKSIKHLIPDSVRWTLTEYIPAQTRWWGGVWTRIVWCIFRLWWNCSENSLSWPQGIVEESFQLAQIQCIIWNIVNKHRVKKNL